MIIEQMKGKLNENDIKYFSQKEKLWTSLKNKDTRENAFNMMGRQATFVWIERVGGNNEPVGTLVERWRKQNRTTPDVPIERKSRRVQTRSDQAMPRVETRARY